MYKIISKDNKIFRDENFQKDKYLFNILINKINHPNAKIMSDEGNYIITNESPETAPWIWTKDNFDKSKLHEIEELINIYLINGKMSFTCKKELYDMLIEDKFYLIPEQKIFQLGFMRCDSLIEPKLNDGYIDFIKPGEEDIIIKYVLSFEKLMDDSITGYSKKSNEEIYEECKNKAKTAIESGTFYILRNRKGKIVSMARYNIGENDTAKVGLVYTPDEERGKGYAAKLVYEITKIILEKNMVPILYTDLNYPYSNKAYANVGYKNCGTLVTFDCFKNVEKK